jgi:hypothetical protein
MTRLSEKVTTDSRSITNLLENCGDTTTSTDGGGGLTVRVLSRCLGGRTDRSIRVTAAAAVVELGPLGPRTASSPQDRGRCLSYGKSSWSVNTVS